MIKVSSQSVGALVLVVIAFAILFFSLRAPNVGYISGSENRVEQQSLAKFMKNEWIPGHPLYPALMLRDRLAVLSTSKPEDRSLLFVELAEQRRRSATVLLDRKEAGLAIATLSKSQAYLLQAGAELNKVRDPEKKNQASAVTIAEIRRFYAEIETWKTIIEDRQKSRLDALVDQLRMMESSIEQQIFKTSETNK